MVALDRRTGDVLMTIAVYAAIGGVLYVARATVAAFVVALLFAYLIEPVIGSLERRLAGSPHPRGFAIATLYIVATVIIGVGAYLSAPTVMKETQRIQTELSGAIVRLKAALPPGQAGLVSGAVGRASDAAGNAVHDLVWLLAVPVLAIFFLGSRAGFIDRAADLFADSGERATARRTLKEVDRTLAAYARAQLILAALSALFYGVAMMLLGFPYPLMLGILGGVLELIPAMGWILAAAAILVSGAEAHAPWVWMALLLGAWRLVQDFVNAPRVMSERLQLDPFVVFFAMMVGGQLGGVSGVMFSVPAVAVARVLWDEHRSQQPPRPVTLVTPDAGTHDAA